MHHFSHLGLFHFSEMDLYFSVFYKKHGDFHAFYIDFGTMFGGLLQKRNKNESQ